MMLTVKQKRVYNYLINFAKENLYQPSLKEMQIALGYKQQKSIIDYLQRIEDKGLIKLTGKKRAIIIKGYN